MKSPAMVYALPTESKTCLIKNIYKFKPEHGNPWECHTQILEDAVNRGYEFNYLYLTSNEEITEKPETGTWVINKNGDTLYQIKDDTFSVSDWKYWSKVVASNNPILWKTSKFSHYSQDLMKVAVYKDSPSGIHKIGTDFIEAFVREQGIWEVMLDMEIEEFNDPTGKYSTYKVNSEGEIVWSFIRKSDEAEEIIRRFKNHAEIYGYPSDSFREKVHNYLKRKRTTV
jgi:hypothetical protein